MWLDKLSLKAAALILVGAVSSMAAKSSISPLTFGSSVSSQQEVNNWNYLTRFKLWGTTGIQFGWRPEFYDTRYYNKSGSGNYNGVNILDSLGWVGTASGNLSSEGGKNGGWLDGPIIVGGSITTQQMTLVTGPVRTGTGNISCSHNGTTCVGTNSSGNCAYDKVPEIRSDLKVPTLEGVNWSNYSALNLNKTDSQRRTVLNISSSGQSTCPKEGICDLFFSSINFDQDNRLVIQMPEGGRITRIFTNSLSTKTHPQIVVNYGNGDLDASSYEGNLLIYVNSNVSFENTDYADFMGTYVINGTLTGKSNMTVVGQFIANKIVIGDDFKAQNFVFKPFVVWPTLSILNNGVIKFEENDSWTAINVALSEESTEPVSFEYCFEFNSKNGTHGVYAGYDDVGAADASHKFPICNENQFVKVTIPVGEKKAAGIYIKPLIDGLVENDEQLYFQVNNLVGANLAPDYEKGHGYKIFIASNDKLPTVSSELVVNVKEDTKYAFTAAEFNFQHAKQKFASVIITGLPDKGTLAYDGTALISSGKTVAVADLGKLTYQAEANEFGNSYTKFRYKVVGDGTGDNTSKEYVATVNVVPVNDKPKAADVIFQVNELDHAVSGGPIVVTDVSNERNVDTYTYTLVNVAGSDYAAFNNLFTITKLNNQNATLTVKSGAVFNYSVKSEYVVYATVKDNAKTETSVVNGPLTSDQFKITVKIKNENDAPVIANQSFTIPEKNTDGSDWTSAKIVGDVVASDPDGDGLTFSVVDAGIPFNFRNSGSELHVADGSKLDYETKPTWTFKVSVSDGQATATATITVNLTNVNEPPPPPDVKKEYSVNENSAKGTVLGTFIVKDYDKVGNNFEKLTYTLTGSLASAVNTEGSLTGKSLADIFELVEVDPNGGERKVEIRVKDQSLLNYEELYNPSTKNATYPVTFTITDQANHTVSKTTNIVVVDVNETFTATGGTFYLQEQLPIGSPVCVEYEPAVGDIPGDCKKQAHVEGIDLDIYNPTFSTLTFKISSNNTGDMAKDAKRFAVGTYDGALSSNDDFDYETQKHTYVFLVTVSDIGFSQDVEVTVKMDNITEPKIEYDTEGSAIVKENATGEVESFADVLDTISDPDIRKQLDEITTPISYDIDRVASAEAGALFDIDDQLGSITVKSNVNIDFESLYPKNTYTVAIVASGENSAGNKVVINMNRKIVVVDVNEKPEIKSKAPISVPETATSKDGAISRIEATDPDNAYGKVHPLGFNKLTYKVDEVIEVDGSKDFPFEVDPNTGEISISVGKELNYTKQKQYKFIAKVMDRSTDSENPSQFDLKEITINVTDVNRPSEFKVLTNPYEVEENVTVGTELDGKQIVVYDEDIDDRDMLKVSITDNDATAAIDAAKLFEVVQVGKTNASLMSTFVIKTKADLDYETLYKAVEKDAVFNITLTVTDTKGNKTSQDTRIRVIDVNEEPSFTNPPYSFTVSENTTKATLLGVASATDPDKWTPNFHTLYFSLSGSEAAQFDIDKSTGELFTRDNAKFDYETKKSYTFKVIVTDKEFTKEANVTVSVKDEKEVPKFPDDIPTLTVNENTLEGEKVGVVAATDDDCSNNNQCKPPVYTLTASTLDADDYKAFKIDSDGTIRVIKDSILNYEVQNEYFVRVVATDGDDPTLSSSVEVKIAVNDVNDAPTYKKKEYVFEIHENAPVGEFIGTVVADDEDTWSKLTYVLSDYESGSKDAAAFKIDAGKIYLVADTLNYEKKRTYQVWAKATDNGDSKGFKNYSATTLVTINLIDDPDKPEIIDDGKNYDVNENTVDQNTPTGFEIACYDVHDEDTNSDHAQVATLVPYVTDAGNTDADRLFDAKIKKEGSGYKLCLIVKNGDRLNYEAVAHTHKVNVSVMDDDQLTAQVTKTINIVDVNEMPIISGGLEISFYEGKAAGTVIGKLYSNDIDTSKVFTDNVFNAVSGDTAYFSITEDGKIKTKKKFDYELEQNHRFEIVVSLSDRNTTKYPTLTTKKTVAITLKDMPEVPEITSTEFSVKENSPEDLLIGIIEATDPDGAGDLLFALTEESPYVIVKQNGEIRVRKDAKIDYEKMQQFTIKVKVKDSDGLESEGNIVIKVIDVNEAPKIEPQEFTFPEDSKPGDKKGPVKATDPDTKNPDFNDLKFYPVDENEKFEIKPNGDIVLKSELDYERDSLYVIKVRVTDGEFSDTTEIKVKVGNVVEKSEVEITRVETDSVYIKPTPKDTIFTNKDVVSVEWKQDDKIKTSLDTLKSEGCHDIIKTYKDPSKDLAGSDTVVVCYSTAAPIVDVDAKKTKVEADNIYTIVEEVDKKDSSIYVNKSTKDVNVSVKDTVSNYNKSFKVDVVLDTIAISDRSVKNMVDISKSEITLEKNPKSEVKSKSVGDKTKVSYKKFVKGDSVTVSYYVDDKGEQIKVPVIGDDGKKKNVAVIEVSTVVVVKGKDVIVSYKADAETGEILYGDSEGNLMYSIPKGSSSKSESKDKDDVDLKTGVGAFTVTYTASGDEKNGATVTYVIDEKGKIVANEEGDRGYLVTYTYTNRYNNTAEKSVFMVLDKKAPFVKIKSPSDGDVVYANFVDVDWCISVDGDANNCVTQDTLNFQSLHQGVNTIKRIYRDKAGNETIAQIEVMLKKAKDIDVNLEQPMIIVSRDSVIKYYENNPPEEEQTYSVSVLNQKSQTEKEVVRGNGDESKPGSGEEPYPGLGTHLGPTITIDLRLPIVSPVGGLSTLDDIIINGDMIPLEGLDAANSKKVTVKEYVKEYCSEEFQRDLEKSKDNSKATLYTTKAHVTLWFYTTVGQFVDKYQFDYEIDDPENVDKAGLVKLFFEKKLDLNGELRDENGRLYGTGPYIVRTKVDVRSKQRCVVPPVAEGSKIGDVLKSSDEMLKRFGYRRPVLRGNEKPIQRKSSKSGSKNEDSKKKK